MSDVREVVGSLKILAAEPENRSHIIQDETCLQGVINFLQNPDPKIVFMALEVVQLLADGQENRSQLAKQAELVKSVRKIMLDISADPQAKRIASSIYASLQSHFQPSSSTSSTQAPLRDTTNTPRGSEAGTGGVGLSIFSQKVSNSLSSAKTHIYYIPSLTNDTARSQIESKLLQIKGVVSFLLDVKTHRATIRSLLAPMDLVGAMKRAGIPNPVPVTENSENPSQKENEPQYLPDDNGVSSSSWFSTLSIWGASTVDERNETQRRREKKNQYKSGRFMSSLYSVGEALKIF